MSDQLISKYPSHQAYKKEDFYVSPSNRDAYDFIDSWPKWIKRTANIFGPPGSGKSHFASILKNKTLPSFIRCLYSFNLSLNIESSI